jgi:transcription elongation factor Elf1
MKYEIGQYYTCPVCSNQKASIIWKSEDGKIIGVKCERPHNNKTNSVILIET